MKLRPVTSLRRAARETPRVAPAEGGQALPSDVRGLVDNATGDRLFGWAWDAARPGERLRVELRLAGEVVASTIADFARPDLAGNGVGDGCHAFEFPLTPEWAERRAELTAVAHGGDGTEVPIAMRIRRPEDALAATGLQHAMETLLTEQQRMRHDVASLRDRTAALPDAAAMEGIATAQAALERKVEALELWLTRLDGTLGEAAGRREGGAGGRVDLWEAVLIAVLTGAASAALAVAVVHYVAG